ncbi:MAG: SMP-30/gluconolactonase/LRE family protein [Mycobacteriaceae bacterium]
MREKATRAGVVAAAITLSLSYSVSSAFAEGVPESSEPNFSDCQSWHTEVLASGFNSLENLAFDDRGKMLVSQHDLLTGIGSFFAFAPDGTTNPVIDSIANPGGIVVNGETAYINTADSFVSALTNNANGTVELVNLDSGEYSTYASGLTMPNGLAILPDGTAITSRMAGANTGLFSSQPGSDSPEPYALQGVSVNGIALEETGRWLYTISSVAQVTTVYIIDTLDPAAPPQQFELPGFGLLNFGDDLTVDAEGVVYAALDLQGLVARLDTKTGESCTIATGQPGLSSVRFGAGPGWDEHSLYGTTLLGSIIRISAT